MVTFLLLYVNNFLKVKSIRCIKKDRVQYGLVILNYSGFEDNERFFLLQLSDDYSPGVYVCNVSVNDK